ncbi:hypothetical protein ACX1C1_04835 [Paenibacillus sp. strain BS8-2]
MSSNRLYYNKEPLRVAFAGDSITWGEGLLNEGFVDSADRLLRERAAYTLFHNELHYNGELSVVVNPKLYGGEASMLSGAGSEATFRWNGDRLVLITALQRRNEEASLIELYVDGQLTDSFSTYNESPCGSEALSFIADGLSDKYDLGHAFTYSHQVTVDGEVLIGELNRSGYGGAMPEGHAYKVIRKSVFNPVNEQVEIRHFLWFLTPPRAGSNIEATFQYGESVTYARTTVGEIGAELSDPLESPFGEGDVAFDPAHPRPLSSGLDFRASNAKAMREWSLTEGVEHEVTFRVVGFDPRGSCSGKPYLIVNAVTDRAHHILNAGIGGWTAKLFNEDRALRNIAYVAAWQPDLVVIGLGTNDDWGVGNGFVASRRLQEGISEASLRQMPTLVMKRCAMEREGLYEVETSELLIEGLTERSVTIDGANADLSDVREGDIVVLGDYWGDNRNVQCRIIERWESSTRTAVFDNPLAPTPITHQIGNYIGQKVRVKRIDGFLSELRGMIRTIRESAPSADIALIETGLSNFNTRLLMGYAEQMTRLSAAEGARHIRIYDKLANWQYGRERDLNAWLDRAGNTSANGAVEYLLCNSNGEDIQAGVGYTLRNWSVKVDGLERYGDGCHVEGGYALAFRPEAAPHELIIDNWNGRARHPAVWYRFLPTKLIFVERPPIAGSTIEVTVSSDKWSPDDAHLTMPGGLSMYAEAVCGELEDWLRDR